MSLNGDAFEFDPCFCNHTWPPPNQEYEKKLLEMKKAAKIVSRIKANHINVLLV